MRAKPWEVPDGLWQRLEPLLPKEAAALSQSGSPAAR
jgi:hypothetical protein